MFCDFGRGRFLVSWTPRTRAQIFEEKNSQHERLVILKFTKESTPHHRRFCIIQEAEIVCYFARILASMIRVRPYKMLTFYEQKHFERCHPDLRASRIFRLCFSVS